MRFTRNPQSDKGLHRVPFHFMHIALLVFSLLTVAGAWTGWRRSPLYSRKITLQLVAAFVPIGAVIVGVALPLAHGAGDSSRDRDQGRRHRGNHSDYRRACGAIAAVGAKCDYRAP